MIVKRKIVQIAFEVFGSITDGDGDVESRLNILDDHGDVFELRYGEKGARWEQIKLPVLPDKEIKKHHDRERSMPGFGKKRHSGN